MGLKNVFKSVAMLFIALLFGNNAVLAQADKNSIDRVVYKCARNIEFPVVYVNGPNNDAYAVFAVDNRLILAKSSPSGSGVQYVSDDKSQGYHWHTKGPEGLLYFSEVGQAGQEEFILRDCIEVGR